MMDAHKKAVIRAAFMDGWGRGAAGYKEEELPEAQRKGQWYMAGYMAGVRSRIGGKNQAEAYVMLMEAEESLGS